MTDELEQIRALRGDPPPPSQDWVSDTRAELLAMAEEERRQRTATATRPSWRERLVALFGGRRPLALAGAVALTGVVAVGAVLLAPDPEESTEQMAEPTQAPTATQTAPASPATPAEPESPAEPEPDEEVVLASSCEGGDGAYSIEYPEGWHTNSGDVIDACQRFDEQPVELEAGTGGAPEHPVLIDVVSMALADVIEPSEAFEEDDRTSTTVDGRDAAVVEWTSTGDGALPEGVRTYRYLVDLGEERTLVISANDLGDVDWDELRAVVDAMAGSLELAADA